MVRKQGGTGALGARGMVLAVLAASACAYTPAGRERAHALEVLSSIEGVAKPIVGCESFLLAGDALCAAVVMKGAATLRFERVGYRAFGPNAVNIVVAEAGNLVPRIRSCESVSSPNFHRDAPLGHHFSPTLVDVREAVSRWEEVLEEVQYWPRCPQAWEVQDQRGVNYRYCAHRKDEPADPPAPEVCAGR
jgi:hypothetical protein